MPPLAVSKVNDWRTMSASDKRRARAVVNARRVVASMAMEGEPVSSAWKTKHQKAA